MEANTSLISFSSLIGAVGFLFTVYSYTWILKRPINDTKIILPSVTAIAALVVVPPLSWAK